MPGRVSQESVGAREKTIERCARARHRAAAPRAVVGLVPRDGPGPSVAACPGREFAYRGSISTTSPGSRAVMLCRAPGDVRTLQDSGFQRRRLRIRVGATMGAVRAAPAGAGWLPVLRRK